MNTCCQAVGCRETIMPKRPLCAKHWNLVPFDLQRLLKRHYVEGQGVSADYTVEYLCTAFACISCVALKEGKTLPNLQPDLIAHK